MRHKQSNFCPRTFCESVPKSWNIVVLESNENRLLARVKEDIYAPNENRLNEIVEGMVCTFFFTKTVWSEDRIEFEMNDYLILCLVRSFGDNGFDLILIDK